MKNLHCAGRRQKTYPSTTRINKNTYKPGGKKKGKKKKKTGR